MRLRSGGKGLVLEPHSLSFRFRLLLEPQFPLKQNDNNNPFLTGPSFSRVLPMVLSCSGSRVSVSSIERQNV